MRTTYLLQEKQLDGSTCLVETTAENWHAIVRACAKLPTDQRRYFIRDVIPDDKGVDCMFIETTKETWQEWDREQRRIRDNLQHRTMDESEVSVPGSFYYDAPRNEKKGKQLILGVVLLVITCVMVILVSILISHIA